MKSGLKQASTTAKATMNNTKLESSLCQPEIMKKSQVGSPTSFNNYTNMTPTPAVSKRMNAARSRETNLSNLYRPSDQSVSKKSLFQNYNSLNSSS